MALELGYDDLEPNHIHNIKPMVALPYYQLFTNNFMFKYTSGINAGQW